MCAQAKPLMQLPPKLATVDASLAQALQLAGASSSACEDPLFPNVNARLNISQRDADVALADSAPAYQVSCPRLGREASQVRIAPSSLERMGPCTVTMLSHSE